jgi:hypothetical protein
MMKIVANNPDSVRAISIAQTAQKQNSNRIDFNHCFLHLPPACLCQLQPKKTQQQLINLLKMYPLNDCTSS